MKLVKQELTDVIDIAVKDWLTTMRGASLAGPKARVIRVGPAHLQVFVKSERHPEIHEVLEIQVQQKF